MLRERFEGFLHLLFARMAVDIHEEKILPGFAL
jgi:hypothetical protein